MQIGELIVSTRGRDADEYFFVASVQGEYVFLVDGKIRKMAKPKRKKIKHTASTKYIHEGLAEKFFNKSLVHDKEIFSAIRRWKEENIKEISNVEG